MTKKEAINYCIKMCRKSKMKVLFSTIVVSLAVGNIYKNAYNAGVYRTGERDIESTADDDDEIALTINGKEV